MKKKYKLTIFILLCIIICLFIAFSLRFFHTHSNVLRGSSSTEEKQIEYVENLIEQAKSILQASSLIDSVDITYKMNEQNTLSNLNVHIYTNTEGELDMEEYQNYLSSFFNIDAKQIYITYQFSND